MKSKVLTTCLLSCYLVHNYVSTSHMAFACMTMRSHLPRKKCARWERGYCTHFGSVRQWCIPSKIAFEIWTGKMMLNQWSCCTPHFQTNPNREMVRVVSDVPHHLPVIPDDDAVRLNFGPWSATQCPSQQLACCIL